MAGPTNPAQLNPENYQTRSQREQGCEADDSYVSPPLHPAVKASVEAKEPVSTDPVDTTAFAVTPENLARQVDALSGADMLVFQECLRARDMSLVVTRPMQIATEKT